MSEKKGLLNTLEEIGAVKSKEETIKILIPMVEEQIMLNKRWKKGDNSPKKKIKEILKKQIEDRNVRK